MKIKKIKNEHNIKVSIELVDLTKTLCAFRAVRTTVVDGKTTTENSEGIALTKNVRASQKACTLPINNRLYIKKNDELLELFRVYGFVGGLGDDCDFDGVQPKLRMDEIIEKSHYTFDEVLNSSAEYILKNLLFLNYSSYGVKFVSSGRACNVARFAEHIMLKESQYKNYEKIIDKMIEDGKLKVKRDYRNNLFDSHYGSSLKYVNGKVNFTNEEFYKIIGEPNVFDPKRDYIDDFQFYQAIEKFNVLGINDELKTEEEKEQDYQRDNQDECHC